MVVALGCGGRIDGGDGGVQDGGVQPDVILIGIDASPSSCNTVPVVGTDVPLMAVASDPPPSSGPAQPFALGLYALEKITWYTGPGGTTGNEGTVSATLQITSAKNGFIFDAVASSNQEAPTRTSSTAMIVGGSGLVITTFCPSAQASTKADYEFDGKTLTLRTTEQDTPQTIDEEFVLITH